MLISPENRMSQISACLDACAYFLLSAAEAIQIAFDQIEYIGNNWQAVCEHADLVGIERNMLWGRQFLNPFAFTGLDAEARELQVFADQIRESAG